MRAKALVNAAGPWVAQFIGDKLQQRSPYGIRLIQGSHIIVPKLYEGEQAISFDKGEEMGRFRLGSTVIMVMPKGSVSWNSNQVAGKTVRMGEAFGALA